MVKLRNIHEEYTIGEERVKGETGKDEGEGGEGEGETEVWGKEGEGG